MTVFNKKYTEIINLAANKDPELEGALRVMLSKLNQKHKQACFNGIEIHDDGAKVNFENFEKKYKDEKVDESYLIVENEGLTYMLNLTNFTSEWVDKVEPYDDYMQAYNKPRVPTEILNLEIRQGEDAQVVKQYVLEVLNLNGKYVLDYYRGYPTEDDKDYVEEVNSVVSITKEELNEIANLECPVILNY